MTQNPETAHDGPPDDASGPVLAVSVIIPVRNGLPWIGHQLDALSRQRAHGPWEVIVVDNGSTDGTAAFLESWSKQHDHVRVLDGADLPGASAARNAGAAVRSVIDKLFAAPGAATAPKPADSPN